MGLGWRRDGGGYRKDEIGEGQRERLQVDTTGFQTKNPPKTKTKQDKTCPKSQQYSKLKRLA